MKKLFTCALFITAAFALNAQDSGLPANPQPGKCYVKCITPDEFGKESVRILKTPEYKTLSIVPATYKTVEDRVLIKEQTKEYIYHPAEYKTERVRFIGKEKEPTLAAVPARLSPSSQTIETYPKTSGWVYTRYEDCKSANPNDCQVLCYKEYPAEFVTVPTQVLDVNATTTSGENPEIEQFYEKEIIVKAAYTEERIIPAEYTTITRQVIDQPAKVVETIVPAVYEDVEKTVLTKKGGIQIWEEIDCELVEPNILPIFWDFNSAVLNNEAKRIVDQYVYSLMTEKPNISVELSSHTDSRGSDEYNRSLSQRRADAIKNYLIQKGISSSRLVSTGYGESRLKNKCGNGVECSEEMHQANRRTEYRVINR